MLLFASLSLGDRILQLQSRRATRHEPTCAAMRRRGLMWPAPERAPRSSSRPTTTVARAHDRYGSGDGIPARHFTTARRALEQPPDDDSRARTRRYGSGDGIPARHFTTARRALEQPPDDSRDLVVSTGGHSPDAPHRRDPPRTARRLRRRARRRRGRAARASRTRLV